MDQITNYINQITNAQYTVATVTLEKIINDRVKARFNKHKDSVKKK